MTSSLLFCYDATLIVSNVKVQRMEVTFQFFSEDEVFEAEGQKTLDSSEERTLKVCLDKWLWAARFFKTRAVARAAVEKGKVFYNGQRSKPSRKIDIGAIVQIRQGGFEKTVIIKGLSTRRRSTEEALQLFEETEDSRANREALAEWSPPPPQYAPGNQTPSFYPTAEQPRERRMVRFLRRSFVRGDQPRQDRNSSHPINQQIEHETFE